MSPAYEELKRVARQTCREWASLTEAQGAAIRVRDKSILCGLPMAVEVVMTKRARYKVQPYGVSLRQHHAPVFVALPPGRCLLCAHAPSRQYGE